MIFSLSQTFGKARILVDQTWRGERDETWRDDQTPAQSSPQ
jgi:hypothetical protein